MGIRVLLVDDEEEFVTTLGQRLEVRGFGVNTAFNGPDALEWLEENDVDVIVLDVLMPQMDGLETLRQIRSKDAIVEVIMLTGHGTVENAIKGMKLGAYDYLMKPTQMEELVEKLNGAYKRKAEQDERIRQAEVSSIVRTRGW